MALLVRSRCLLVLRRRLCEPQHAASSALAWTRYPAPVVSLHKQGSSPPRFTESVDPSAAKAAPTPRRAPPAMSITGAHHTRRISRSERTASRRHSNSALLCHRRDMSNRTDWPAGLNAFLPRPLAATADSFLVHNKNRGSSYGEPSRAFWLPFRPAAAFAPNFTCCSCVLLSPSPSF